MVVTLPLDSFHTAHLDVAAGVGLVVCPSAETDVRLGRESVLGAAWADATTRLASLGWWPSRGPAGLPSDVAVRADGRLVVQAQDGRRQGTLDRDAWAALCDAAGFVPDAEHPRA